MIACPSQSCSAAGTRAEEEIHCMHQDRTQGGTVLDFVSQLAIPFSVIVDPYWGLALWLTCHKCVRRSRGLFAVNALILRWRRSYSSRLRLVVPCPELPTYDMWSNIRGFACGAPASEAASFSLRISCLRTMHVLKKMQNLVSLPSWSPPLTSAAPPAPGTVH
jgi:hypothetical protein